MLHPTHARFDRVRLGDLSPSAVSTPIVNENEFILDRHRLKSISNFPHQRQDVVLLVVYRNYD